MSEKFCTVCGEAKATSDFYVRVASPDGLQASCKPCNNERRKRYHHMRPDRVRGYKLRSNFNITLEERDARLAAQGGMCAVCGRDSPGSRDWHTDHDSTCCPAKGKSCGHCIRGILCGNCNTALGLANDDTEILRSMISYLEASRVLS